MIKIAPTDPTTKTFIKFNFNEKVSSKVSSLRMTNLLLLYNLLRSSCRLSLLLSIF